MNLVFDFAGVVFRWHPHEFMPRLLPRRAGTEAAAAQLVQAFFADDWLAFDRGAVDEALLADRIAWRTGIPIHEVKRVIDAVPGELQPVARIVRLMERLRERGHRLFYLSNMPAPVAAHLAATHDFMRWFDAGLFSSQVRRVKPEHAIFHEAQRRFGVAPRELLFVDDAALNVAAARALGWQGIHFLGPEQCEAELAARELL